MPLLALSLLVLNGRTRFVGRQHRNTPCTSLVLIAALVFFVLMGMIKLFPDHWVPVRNQLFGGP